eukprot:3275999-Rhodomonas_salina.2
MQSHGCAQVPLAQRVSVHTRYVPVTTRVCACDMSLSARAKVTSHALKSRRRQRQTDPARNRGQATQNACRESCTDSQQPRPTMRNRRRQDAKGSGEARVALLAVRGPAMRRLISDISLSMTACALVVVSALALAAAVNCRDTHASCQSVCKHQMFSPCLCVRQGR